MSEKDPALGEGISRFERRKTFWSVAAEIVMVKSVKSDADWLGKSRFILDRVARDVIHSRSQDAYGRRIKNLYPRQDDMSPYS